jgi:hypothetical protein
MRQIKLLAGLYQRPLSLFFLPEPPKVVPLAAAYRRLAEVVPASGRRTSPEQPFLAISGRVRTRFFGLPSGV